MQKKPQELLLEIETLRTQLHDKAKGNNFVNQLFMNNELIHISKKLDELIIQYMKIAK